MRRSLRKLLCAAVLVLGWSLSASAVTLTGTITDPSGAGVTGRLYMSLSQQTDQLSTGGCGGPAVLAPTAQVVITLTAGVIQGSPTVVGNDCMAPTNTFYVVTVRDAQNNILFTQNWQVTVANCGSPCNVGQIPPILVPQGTVVAGAGYFTTLTVANLNLTGTINANLTTSALKPQSGDGFQCVSAGFGNDSNDGLSCGTAKLTIGAAIAALPSAPGKGYVFVMDGTYTLAATVNNRTDTEIHCSSGAVITQANGTNLTTFMSFAGADHATLDGCTVDGNQSGNTESGAVALIVLSGSTNAKVTNNRIRNSPGVCVYTGTATTPTVSLNLFPTNSCPYGGIESGFTGSTVATKGTYTDNTMIGVGNLLLSFSDGNTIKGNHITGYGQAQNVTTTGTSVAYVSGTNFANLVPGMYICINSVEYQITVVSSNTVLTIISTAGNQTNVLSYAGTADSLNIANSSGNTVSGNVITSGEGYGVVVFQNGSGEASLHNTITANTITLMGGDCIALNSTNSTPILGGTVVGSNTISDCGQGGAAKSATANRMGIECNGTGTHYSAISGNAIYDDQMSPTTLYGYINQTCPADQVVGQNSINGTVNTQTGYGASEALLNMQGPLAPITGNSADQTVYTYTIPANTVAAAKCIRTELEVTHTTGSTSVSYKVFLGATSSSAFGYNDNGANVYFTTKICNTTAQSAQTGVIFGESTVSASPVPASLVFSPSENMVNAIVVKYTFNVANTDAITPKLFTVELIQ